MVNSLPSDTSTQSRHGLPSGSVEDLADLGAKQAKERLWVLRLPVDREFVLGLFRDQRVGATVGEEDIPGGAEDQDRGIGGVGRALQECGLRLQTETLKLSVEIGCQQIEHALCSAGCSPARVSTASVSSSMVIFTDDRGRRSVCPV